MKCEKALQLLVMDFLVHFRWDLSPTLLLKICLEIFLLQWCRSQAAQLCYPQVCACATDQEWQEGDCIRPPGWLP